MYKSTVKKRSIRQKTAKNIKKGFFYLTIQDIKI